MAFSRGNTATTDRDPGDDFLMGGGKVPSASFLRKGDSISGVICEKPVTRQQTDPKTREPMTWRDGSPRMQLVVTLQTDERDPEIEDDDGRRRVYLKYKLRDAVADAVREAEAPGLRVGGFLTVTFTKQDRPARAGLSGTKHYAAEYEPPDEDADVDAELNATDDEDDVEEAPPPRRAAKKAPAKAAARRPAPVENDEDDAEEAPPPRKAAKKAPAKASRRRNYTDTEADPGF